MHLLGGFIHERYDAILADPAIQQEYRGFARHMVLTYSALAVLILPAYQMLDLFSMGSITPMWWQNATWRALVIVVGLAALAWCGIRENGYGAPLMLRLLTVSLMVMMFGLFTSHYLSPEGDVAMMVNGLIIITFVVSLASLRGARELLLIFCLPLIVTLTVLGWRGESLLAAIYSLVNVFAAVVIAMFTSELLSRNRLASFAQQMELRKHASTDPLTGLNNRRFVEPQIRSEIGRAQRHNTTFAVVMADLDRFKRINDEYGHNVGDAVLQTLAARMLATVRQEDRAVRWGGEEFLVLMPEADADQARLAAERIRRAIGDTPFEINGLQIPITISLGVAVYAGEDDPEALTARADQALYRAKQAGRNRVCV